MPLISQETWRAYATKRTYFHPDWIILTTGKRWRTLLRARWHAFWHGRTLVHVIRESSWEDFERIMTEAGYTIEK